MTAYYNENDRFAAAWLRELVANGHIAPGDVDERSILDVRAGDLAGYDQCHFFAGIGTWSYALRLAGWPDDCPVWTGSVPCQPLSGAGQRKGHADARHLWPHFHDLIVERAPAILLGEQVAGKDGREWLAAVRADLEDVGYAVGAADLCAAGIGAPHIRQRLWWVAQRLGDAASQRERADEAGRDRREAVELARPEPRCDDSDNGATGRLADAVRGRTGHRPGESMGEEAAADGEDGRLPGQRLRAGQQGATGRLADAARRGDADQRGSDEPEVQRRDALEFGAVDGAGGGNGGGNGAAGTGAGRAVGGGEDGARPAVSWPGAADGFWRDADWLFCRDGKWRPVEPGTSPLVAGAPARVGRLRGYGNAIVAPFAATFIESVMDVIG